MQNKPISGSYFLRSQIALLREGKDILPSSGGLSGKAVRPQKGSKQPNKPRTGSVDGSEKPRVVQSSLSKESVVKKLIFDSDAHLKIAVKPSGSRKEIKKDVPPKCAPKLNKAVQKYYSCPDCSNQIEEMETFPFEKLASLQKEVFTLKQKVLEKDLEIASLKSLPPKPTQTSSSTQTPLETHPPKPNIKPPPQKPLSFSLLPCLSIKKPLQSLPSSERPSDSCEDLRLELSRASIDFSAMLREIWQASSSVLLQVENALERVLKKEGTEWKESTNKWKAKNKSKPSQRLSLLRQKVSGSLQGIIDREEIKEFGHELAQNLNLLLPMIKELLLKTLLASSEEKLLDYEGSVLKELVFLDKKCLFLDKKVKKLSSYFLEAD